MPILRFVVCAIISLGLSKAFFHSSIYVMLCIFCVLEYLFDRSKKCWMEHKRLPQYVDKILIAICILGAILMIIGNIFMYSDVCTIVGAMLFSPAVAVLIMLQIYYLWNFVKIKKN